MNDVDLGLPAEGDDEDDEWHLSLEELDELLREDIEAEPQAFEPDAFDDEPDTFNEIAGAWFAVGDEEDDGPSLDVILAAESALRRLSGIEHDIIILRFGFAEEAPMPAARIAERFGYTERHVEKLIASALRKMRRT